MVGWPIERRFAIAPWALAGILALAGTPEAQAHEGPPFPILMDEPVAGYVVSVWADPDIGEARFFIIVETPEGEPPREAPRVSMWTEPVDGRLDRATYEMTRQRQRNRMQFDAEPYFDQRDMWTVGFRVVRASGETGEVTSQVESTPPGYGWWDLAIYLFPFVFLGGFWIVAMRRRRRIRRGSDNGTRTGDAEQAREQHESRMQG